MDQAVVNSAITLTAASFLVVLSRTFLRRLMHEKFLPDDWLMMVSIVFYVVFTTTYPDVVYFGINTTQTDPDKLTDEAIVKITLASKLVLVGRVFYTTYLWSLKGCMLVYYSRLSVRTFELLLVKILAGTVLATWILSLATFFLECRPLDLYWQVLPAAPECAKAVVEVIVMELLNISTDVFIMAIPVPLLLRTRLSTKQKIEVSSVFLGGLFLVIVSVLRILIILGDLTTQNKLIWAQIECFVATIVTNAPVLHEMWRHGWGHIRVRRFGNDYCAPAYSLAIQAPTHSFAARQPPAVPSRSSRIPSRDEFSDPESEPDIERRETASVRGSRNRLGIRKSVREMSQKLRNSLEQLEIEKTVNLVQHSRTRVMSPDHARPAEDDFFSAPPHGKEGIARIRTEVSCTQDELERDRNKAPKSHLARRLFRGEE